MDGAQKPRLIDSATWERDGDVLFVALPERVTQQKLTFLLWIIVVAGLLGPGLHFVCPWIFSSDVPVIPLPYRLGLMALGVACLLALPVLRWRHDRRLRAELETCIEGPGKWAIQLLVLGLRWYPRFPLGRSPRVPEVVRAWKDHPWKSGAPGTVVVNQPKVVGFTVPARGSEADAAGPTRDWYYWASKGLPFVVFGWGLFVFARTLILGNISTQVTITMWVMIAVISGMLVLLLRSPKYRGTSGLMAHTEPGQIQIKGVVFDRDASILLVFGMFGQCMVMLYSEAGKPRAVVPSYFAVTMLPQLLRRWSEPRVAGPVGGGRKGNRGTLSDPGVLRMETDAKQSVLDGVTCERDGDVLYVTIPNSVISPVVQSWATGAAMLSGVIAIFVPLMWLGSRVLSKDPGEPLLWIQISLAVFIVTGIVAVVASLAHQRKLRKALEVCPSGPARWAAELLALGATDSPLVWLPGMPRVTGAVAVWKSHAWEGGAPGVGGGESASRPAAERAKNGRGTVAGGERCVVGGILPGHRGDMAGEGGVHDRVDYSPRLGASWHYGDPDAPDDVGSRSQNPRMVRYQEPVGGCCQQANALRETVDRRHSGGSAGDALASPPRGQVRAFGRVRRRRQSAAADVDGVAEGVEPFAHSVAAGNWTGCGTVRGS